MKENDKGALRITNQFRSKGCMVYDLRCDGARLTVTVSPRTREADLGEWLIEARTGRAPEPALVVEEWGATRIEALQAVGRSWAEKLTNGLPSFDWEAVAKVLTDVRAI